MGREREWNRERLSSGIHLASRCRSPHLLSQVTEKLLEVENETMMKVADMEKLLFQKDKDLLAIRVSWQS